VVENCLRAKIVVSGESHVIGQLYNNPSSKRVINLLGLRSKGSVRTKSENMLLCYILNIYVKIEKIFCVLYVKAGQHILNIVCLNLLRINLIM